MSKRKFLTITEQVAAHLREELLRGRWTVEMPGRHEVGAELGVSDQTAEAGMVQLEKEGMLIPQGPGRRRRIELPAGVVATTSLRVGILGFDKLFRREPYMVELQHQLKEAGHYVEYASKTLLDLKMDVRQVARLVSVSKVDAWVVCASSREILEWFAAQPMPTFALMGRRTGLPLAAVGPYKAQAFSEVARRLVALGHRRVVLLVREELRKPRPATMIQTAFLGELEAHGIQTSSYNLPDWTETPAGFRQVLESLFKLSRPTALILDEAWAVVPTLQFCLAHGIQIPRHLSLVCSDPDPSFDWCVPPISHIRWEPNLMVLRVVRWVNNLARGKRDVRQTLTKAAFFEGGTIGPVPPGG